MSSSENRSTASVWYFSLIYCIGLKVIYYLGAITNIKKHPISERKLKNVTSEHLQAFFNQSFIILSWNWLYIAIHVIIRKQVNLIRLVFQLNILHRIESDILLW